MGWDGKWNTMGHHNKTVRIVLMVTSCGENNAGMFMARLGVKYPFL